MGLLIYLIASFIIVMIAIFYSTYRFCWKCKRFEKIKEAEKIDGFRLTCYHYQVVCKKCGKTLYDKWVNYYDYF